MEISLALTQTLETVIMRQLYPHSKIDIYVQVLQSDGGIIHVVCYVYDCIVKLGGIIHMCVMLLMYIRSYNFC